jgi:methionyl-tRNA formyltransferase
MQPGPVAEAASTWGLSVHSPDREALGALLRGVDVAVVAAYGLLIRPEHLDVPRHGFVNVHFSLLPRWRGASPVVRCLLAGDATTGVSLMAMDAGLDTGPVLVREAIPVLPWDTGGGLTARLAALGADMVTSHLGAVVRGEIEAVPQDDDAATAAGKVVPAEAFVDPARHTVSAVERAIRAFHPKPGAWSMVDGGRIELVSATANGGAFEPGVATLVNGRVILGAVGGSVHLLAVKPEGRRTMDAVAWMNGRRGAPARFGAA